MQLHAAELAIREASWRYDHGLPCGEQANTAKYLAAEAGFFAGDRAMQTHGGMGYATRVPRRAVLARGPADEDRPGQPGDGLQLHRHAGARPAEELLKTNRAVMTIDDDVSPAEYRRITVTPIAGALGAEIGGVDLNDLDDETVTEIRAAWLRHLVVFFRDQATRQRRVRRVRPAHRRADRVPVRARFRRPSRRSSRSRSCRTRPSTSAASGTPTPTYLDRAADGNDAARPRDPARSAATRCSPTMYAAYEALSPAMQALLDPLRGITQLGPRRREQDPRGPHAATRARRPRTSCTRRRTRSCARIPRPVARRCTSTSPTRRASTG